MLKAFGVLTDGFNTIRTGRANPAILDKIVVRGRGQGKGVGWEREATGWGGDALL